MKKSIKLFALALCAFAFTFTFSSCGTKTNTDTVRINIFTEPDSLFPWKSAAADTKAVWYNIYEGLLKFNNDGSLYPALAESYKVSDDSLTYTFKLRQGVKFHNGKEFTADDCIYTLKNLAGLDGLQPRSSRFSIVKKVYSPSPDTFVIELNKTSGAFLTLLAANPILQKDYEENETKPNGTGPYKFVSYSLGEKVVLELNEDYYDKERAGKIKKVEFIIMPDENAIISALQSGQIDIAQRVVGDKAKMLKNKFNVISYPQNTVYEFGLNVSYPPLSDINVRRAITCAIDKKEIMNAVFDGDATEVYSHFSPVLKEFYNDQLSNVYPYNLEKAKEYMAQSNYKDGFKLSITVPSNISSRVEIAELISNMLKPLNINCEIIPIEWTTWLDKVYLKHDHQSTIIDFAGKLEPGEFFKHYYSSDRSNFFQFFNAEFDSAYEKGNSTVDQKQRADLYKKCQEILTKNCPAVYLFDTNQNVVTKKNIAGYTPYPIFFYDISKLYFTE